MTGHGATTGPPGALALCGGTVVVSLDPVEVVTADVTVAGGRVVALGSAPPGVARRDCGGTLLLPGNVCAHTHLYSALARGMPYELAPPADFLQVLQRIWWRLDRALDLELVRLSALRGGLDALLAGTTTVVDHHASPNAIDGSLDVIADALGELGLRSALCYEVSDRDGPERSSAGVEENRRFLATTPSRPLARGLVGAHASFTMSDATLAACADLARSAGAGVHIHVAEDAVDERDSLARSGLRVVERLRDAGLVTDAAVLAHCVHLDDLEREIVTAARATVVHNARSNMNNGVGHARVGDGRIALGTDGIGGDMFTESQAAYFRAKEAGAAVAPSWPLDRLAEGSRLAGRLFAEPFFGTIRPGAPADITVLDYPAPVPLDAANLGGHWVFGLSARQVRDVLVAGDLVVADRRSTRVDEAKVAAESAQAAERLWARLAEIPEHDFIPEGGRR